MYFGSILVRSIEASPRWFCTRDLGTNRVREHGGWGLGGGSVSPYPPRRSGRRFHDRYRDKAKRVVSIPLKRPIL